MNSEELFNIQRNNLNAMGDNISDFSLNSSIYAYNARFKNNPSYNEATIIYNSLEEDLIDTRLVNNSTDLDTKFIYFRPNTKIELGSYICYDNERVGKKTYLIEMFEYNLLSPYGKGYECNNNLIWEEKGEKYSYPCIIENSSYGSKQSKSDDRIMTDDTKAKLRVQNNVDTNRIKKSQRFIFSNSSEDIYSVVDINKSIYKGQIEFILKKEVQRNEDDFENNLGYNKDSNINYNIDIIGEDTIILNKETMFTVNNDENVNLVWSINNSNAIIVSSNNNRCIVKGLVRNKVFKLTCKDTSGNLISEKNIGITI